MNSAGVYRYWAFISYASKQTSVARRLHKRLETYRVPRDLVGRPGRDEPVPRRIFPIFRDRDELPLSSDLGSSIQDALRASRYLIVLCSRSAAASRWVNEEVRYFKSLGRDDRILALIVDGEPNASDDPATADAECFPPALRFRVDERGELTAERTEPIGGDLRPGGDGWGNAFLKAVAGITGLGFDAFARRERKRRRRRQIAAGIAAALVLAAVAFAWDYNRVKVDYYANFASRWGVPHGVGAIDEGVRRSREHHYRVESRRYKVRQVLRLDSAGTAADNEASYGASAQEIFYREDGSVQQIDFRNRYGKIKARQTFSELRRDGAAAVHYVEFRAEHQDAPLALAASTGALDPGFASAEQPQSRSEITAYQIAYDEAGRQARVMYLNAYRRNKANAEGVFGQRFSYEGASDLPSSVENLGVDGSPRPSRGGLLRIAIERGPLGDPSAERYFGEREQPALHRDFYHSVVRRQDAAGNDVESAFFGPDGKPVLHSNGFHRAAYVVDGRGRVVEFAAFDGDNRPVLKKSDGVHRMVWTLDERGEWTSATASGADGQRVFSKRGFHRRTQTVSEGGRSREVASFGIDGRPVLDSDGVHKFLEVGDNWGNLSERASFGVDGQPVLDRDGVHKVTTTVDERGNVTAWAYFGVQGEPVVRKDSYHRTARVFDDRGNVEEEAYFDERGRPWFASKNEMVFRVVRKYDERGNVIEAANFREEKPDRSPLGYHRKVSTFDDRGNLVREAYFDVDGAPARLNDSGIKGGGYHRVERTFDDRGHVTSVVPFDVLGKPADFTDGYQKLTFRYDERGNMEETAVFMLDGRRAANVKERVHRVAFRYDARGNTIEQAVFGIDNRPTLNARGFHKVARAFDDRGSILEESYYGRSGEPVSIDSGYHRVKRTFDARGNSVEQAHFGVTGGPVEVPGASHRVVTSYDERGLASSEAHFDGAGRPALVADGFHRVRYRYDPLGYRIEQAYFDAGDRPVEQRNGYQKMVETRDRFGTTTKIAYFDAAGRPTISSGGSRLVANLFDSFDFLLGKDNVVVIVVPVDLPDEELFLFVEKTRLSFVAGTKVLADVPYKDADGRIYRSMMASGKVGFVEFPPGGEFPKVITAVATVRQGSPASLR